MKRFNKQILEAINKGIQLALDDYQDIEQSNSIFDYNDIINVENQFDKVVIRLFKKLESQTLTNEELQKLVKYCNILNLQYKVSDTNELKNIISYLIGTYVSGDFKPGLDNTINLNWLDVSKILYMNELFKGLQFTSDISKWDVSNVKSMYGMFECCEFESDISKWNVSKVTDMGRMFFISSFNGDISKWNVCSLENAPYMFYYAVNFNSDISKWNTKKLKQTNYMFQHASSFNQDISNWDITHIINSGGMFHECFAFDQDLSKWDGGNLSITTFKQCGISQNHLPKAWQNRNIDKNGKKLL